LKDSLTLEQIKDFHEQDSLQNKLFPLEFGVKCLPSIKIKDSHIKKRIINGQKFNNNEFDNKIKDQIVFSDDDSEKLLATFIAH
ncbi:tRNA pseudouridine synthase B, partial [Staphylococcus aureus]